ncbi:hypothetical protein F4821DRAFT_262636 [Hypoxylon rubiginosum]|uniref:Uncharacterized protein n=1 Tax=Hypoxylon rubiginosum TaxID=110542 RepID=A0ACC0CU13_9PEZI|nr:hypothetical protein F4821DRAFT_262636 [Hypoxylon rubiginosum]
MAPVTNTPNKSLAQTGVFTSFPCPAPAQPQQRQACGRCRKMVLNARGLTEHMQWTHVGTQCHWPGCAITTNNEKEMHEHLKAAHIVAVEVQAPSPDGTMVTKYRCAWPGCGKSVLLFENVPSSSTSKC